MKYLCYFAFLLGFLMFYQTNPLYAFIIMVIVIGTIILIRRRKNGKSMGSRGIFRSGRYPAQDNLSSLLLANMTLLQPSTPLSQTLPEKSTPEKKEPFSKQELEILSIMEVKSPDR